MKYGIEVINFDHRGPQAMTVEVDNKGGEQREDHLIFAFPNTIRKIKTYSNMNVVC